MIYGRDYSEPGSEPFTCLLCSTEHRAQPEAFALCAECSTPIHDCCVISNEARRCEFCREWHCGAHLIKTDCGMVCKECKMELVECKLEPAHAA